MIALLAGAAWAGPCPTASPAAFASCLDAEGLHAHAAVAWIEVASDDALSALGTWAASTGDVSPLRRAAENSPAHVAAAGWLAATAAYTQESAEVETKERSHARLLALSREAWAHNAAGRFKSEVITDRQIMMWDTTETVEEPWDPAFAERTQDLALLDVAQVNFDIRRFEGARVYVELIPEATEVVHLARDLWVAAPPVEGISFTEPKKTLVHARGWAEDTLDRASPFAPATQLALARDGDREAHLARFEEQVADVRAAVASAERGIALWDALSPSLQADLRLCAPIGGAVARLEGLAEETRRLKRVGATAWASAAVPAERAVIDAELAAELPAALRRRLAFAESLADEAAAVRAGEAPGLPTSYGTIADYGFWPGTPRFVPKKTVDDPAQQ